MSFLRQNKNLFPITSQRYLLFQDQIKIAYNILFHAKPAGNRPPFRLAGARSYGYSYVISGHGILEDKAGQSHHLEPGSLFQVSPETFGQLLVAPDQDWYECSISMNDATMTALSTLGVIREEKIHVKATLQESLAESYLHALQACEAHHDDPAASGKVTQAVISIFDRRYRIINEQQDPFTREALSLMRTTCHERDAIASVANTMGMNYHAFRKRLLRSTGYAPKTWQVRYRIQRACELLHNHDIATVATMLGYADRFVFSRQFKQTIGKTPGQLQRELKS